MRGMMHNSRGYKSARTGYSPDHNDRNFDISKADNIDADRTAENVYWRWTDAAATNREAELLYYQQTFSERLEKTNRSSKAKGHPERIKSMTEWMYSKRFCPEETTLQIGKLEEHATPEDFVEIVTDFIGRMQQWNETHGHPFQILTYAIHLDESVPHCQLRKTWSFIDEDGLPRVGQERALEAAGVPLPDPELPAGRDNNRKQVFDKMMRSVWLDVCKEHGYDLERTPVPDARHDLTKEQMLRNKTAELLEKSKALEQSIEDMTHVRAAMATIQPEPPDKKFFGPQTKTLPYEAYKALTASQEALRAFQEAEDTRRRAERQKQVAEATRVRNQARRDLAVLKKQISELEEQVNQLETQKSELYESIDSLQEQRDQTIEELLQSNDFHQKQIIAMLKDMAAYDDYVLKDGRHIAGIEEHTRLCHALRNAEARIRSAWKELVPEHHRSRAVSLSDPDAHAQER